METQRQHEQEQNRPPDEQILQALIDNEDGEADGIPIVRTSTPRPLSFVRASSASEQPSASESLRNTADFPVEAPPAPPVPEEPEEGGQETTVAAVPVSSESTSEQAGESAPEFIWLFEYGLEMDEGYLNSSNRLNGQAHPYGPAVLKGYRIEAIRLHNGQMVPALVNDSSPDREVWGVLYRIPRKLVEQRAAESSLLDNVHSAHLFKAVSVVVQEMYRKRTVQCLTYMPSEATRNDFVSSPPEGYSDHSYARQLLATARQHHLPEVYLQTLATVTGLDTIEADVGGADMGGRDMGGTDMGGADAMNRVPTVRAPGAAPVTGRGEQNTEPLPVVDASVLLSQSPALARGMQEQPTPRGWLLALSLYLVGLFMAALALAVIQTLGYWNQIFTASFAPLGAPWYVLLYGLLGGCISCIMALGRAYRPTVPGFVMLTWFVRPFLGIMLAALAYLVLSSGLFIISIVPTQRYAICSVVGAIAGLCEGRLFFRRG